jgi:quercetin dioxygenase-like cupin family protein
MEGESGALPQVLHDGEGEALWFFGSLLLFKVSASETDGRFCLVEQRAARGMATPLHRQPAADETFTVLEGALRFYLGENALPNDAPAGSTIHVPAGATHAFEVVTPTARWLDLTTAAHEAFFRAAGVPAPTRALPPITAPDAQAVEAALRNGVEILGPPPGQSGRNG